MSDNVNIAKETFLVKPAGYNHSFDVGIAMSCGVEAAIIYNNLVYWLIHNKINGNNQVNGKTWTYDSVEKMRLYVPYLSTKQIRNAIDRLESAKIIVKDNFNENKMDRRSWYALVDESILEFSNNSYDLSKRANASADSGKCISQKGQMHLPPRANDHNTDTILTDNINTSLTVPAEPSAIAEKGEAKISYKIKPRKKIEYPANVQELAALMIQALMKHNPDYRPPSNLEKFLLEVNRILYNDKRSLERIMQVFEWALEDNVERDGFKGWANVMYSANPPDSLRKHFAKITKQMDAKPKPKIDRRTKNLDGTPVNAPHLKDLF